MKITIVYNLDSKKDSLKSSNPTRGFFHTNNQKEAYLHHIEHTDVDSYIINSDELGTVELKSFIEHIKFLNSIVTIFLCNEGSSYENKIIEDKSVKIIKSDEDISFMLDGIQGVNRHSNRVEWPIKVDHWKKEDNGNKKIDDNVLSISSSGCLFTTESLHRYSIKDKVSLTFRFNDFDFYTDGTVVRLTENDRRTLKSIAIEFEAISPQTRKYIKEIINEKILTQIMEIII